MHEALYVVEWIVGIVGLVAFASFVLLFGWFMWSKSRDWKEDDIRLGRRAS